MYNGVLNTWKFSIDEDELVLSDKNPENAKWAMYPTGYNGYLNLTISLAPEVFVNMWHCWYCEPKAQQMVEYYAFSNDSYMSE